MDVQKGSLLAWLSVVFFNRNAKNSNTNKKWLPNLPCLGKVLSDSCDFKWTDECYREVRLMGYCAGYPYSEFCEELDSTLGVRGSCSAFPLLVEDSADGATSDSSPRSLWDPSPLSPLSSPRSLEVEPGDSGTSPFALDCGNVTPPKRHSPPPSPPPGPVPTSVASDVDAQLAASPEHHGEQKSDQVQAFGVDDTPVAMDVSDSVGEGGEGIDAAGFFDGETLGDMDMDTPAYGEGVHDIAMAASPREEGALVDPLSDAEGKIQLTSLAGGAFYDRQPSPART